MTITVLFLLFYYEIILLYVAKIRFYPLIPKSFGEDHPLGADDLPVGDEGIEVHARNEVFASDGHVGLASPASSIASILYRPSWLSRRCSG